MRIKDLPTLAHSVAADDFEDIDGATNGSRQIKSSDKHGQFRNALAPRGGVAFDGSAAKVLGNLTTQALGADPFSINFFLKPKVGGDSSAPNTFALTNDPNNIATANCLTFYHSTTDLTLWLTGTSYTNRNQWVYPGFVGLYGGKVVQITLVRNAAGNPTIYFNGIDVTAAGNFGTLGTPPGWQGSITNTYLVLGPASGGGGTSHFFAASVYNLALSSTDVQEIFELGGIVPERAKFGSQTGQTSGTLVAGKVYRIKTFVAGDDFTNLGAGSNASAVVFISTGTTPTNWAHGSTLLQVGAVVHLPLDDGLGLQLQDIGTNRLHALMTATGVTHIAPLYGPARLRTTSNTNGNQQLGGQVVLLANTQIMRCRARARTGTPTITLGTASGGSQVVASVALSTSWKDLTIALTGGMVGASNISLWAGSNSTDVIEWDVNWEPLSP